MDEYQRAIEHDRRQLALLNGFPPVQFIPGIPESPEARHMRKLIEAGAIQQIRG